MTENLHGIARARRGARRARRPATSCVDIGCNDGTLLDGYQRRGRCASSASTPPTSPATRSRRATTSCATSSARGRCAQRYPDRKAKVDHEHRDVLRPRGPGGVRRATWPTASPRTASGSWSCTTCRSMLELNAFDAIVHEHLEYYSLAVIERLLAEAGLEVVAAELNDINGGSIRLFIAHAGRREPTPEAADARSRTLRVREFELALDSPDALRAVPRATSSACATSCASSASRSSREGKTIHVYGASTKGNTILQYAGLDRRADPLRRRPQPRQVGLGDDPHADPDHQRGGVARDEARTTTSCCPGTSSTSSSSASATTSRRRPVHRAAARGAGDRRGKRSVEDVAQVPALKESYRGRYTLYTGF